MLKNVVVKLALLVTACVAVALTVVTHAQDLIFEVRGLNLVSYIALAIAFVMLMVVKVVGIKDSRQSNKMG